MVAEAVSSASQIDADRAIRDLLAASLKPDSTIFTDHVAHLCQAYRLLGIAHGASGEDAQLRDRLYGELAACARWTMPGSRRGPKGQSENRAISAESLRDLCEGALALMGLK